MPNKRLCTERAVECALQPSHTILLLKNAMNHNTHAKLKDALILENMENLRKMALTQAT